MAFQGSLHEFSASEILQLVGSQKKSGALRLESGDRRMSVHVIEGRIVSTRAGGAAPDDPLLRFLLRVRRLTDEQAQGVFSVHRESGRDLEDILINGGYVDAEELAGHVERQVLEDLTDASEWTKGRYQFDTEVRWDQPPLIRMSTEGALIEAARRADERQRFRGRFKDPQEIPSVCDMPNPDVEIAPDETELFSVIDGRRTIAEAVAAAALSDYEAYDALQRMMEAGWVEIVGRREGKQPALAPVSGTGAPRPARVRSRVSPLREVAVTVVVLGIVAGLRIAGAALGKASDRQAPDSMFAAAQVRDVRFALEVFRRESGRYPENLNELVRDRWLERQQLVVDGRALEYRRLPEREDYELKLGAP